MEYIEIKSKIRELGISNKYIINQIYIEKGMRIRESQFSTAISEDSWKRSSTQEQIVKMTVELLDKLEAERRKV